MQLHIEKVTKNNELIIKTVVPFLAQENYIESVETCLEEAKQEGRWRPVGIYDEDTLVGFAMYGCFHEQGEKRVWLDRFLIAKEHQNKGYGKAAVLLLVSQLVEEYQVQKVFLSVYEENTNAISLYQEIGFAFNGEVDTKGEKVMVYSKNES